MRSQVVDVLVGSVGGARVDAGSQDGHRAAGDSKADAGARRHHRAAGQQRMKNGRGRRRAGDHLSARGALAYNVAGNVPGGLRLDLSMRDTVGVAYHVVERRLEGIVLETLVLVLVIVQVGHRYSPPSLIVSR